MYKILIASDRSEIRTQVKTLCEHQGFTLCGEATNLEQALTFSELHIPNVVILSFSCSVRTQAGVVSKIAKLGQNVNILVYSSLGPSRATQAFLRAGASGFLSAQCSAEEFVAIIHGIIAGFTLVPMSVLKQPRIKLAHRPAATYLDPALASFLPPEEEQSEITSVAEDLVPCPGQEIPMLPLICFNEP
jgi:DNA-binding NarL/FixJ family response regulator